MSSLPMRAAAAISALALALALNGCSSDGRVGTGAATSGYSYGTGPGNTRPYPQQTKVDLNGVSGVTIKKEVQQDKAYNRTYTVLGQTYQVWTGLTSYIEEGTASWYGPGFHGKKTSMGEIYNQKGYSAAHKNLPLPSYLKVTNLDNGRKIIIRVNDRGPFHGDRIIDLSEGTARYLGVVGKGTAKVRLEYLNVTSAGTAANASGSATALAGTINSASSQQAKSSWPKLASQVLSSSGNSSAQLAAGALTLGSAAAVNQGTQSVNYAPGTAALSGTYVQLVAVSSQVKAEEIRSMMQKRLGVPVFVHDSGGLYRVLSGPFSEQVARQVLNRAAVNGASDSFLKRY